MIMQLQIDSILKLLYLHEMLSFVLNPGYQSKISQILEIIYKKFTLSM
jgi:hypothetical protein